MNNDAYVSTFLTNLAIHFGVKHESPDHGKIWIRDMKHALGSFNQEVLFAAAQEIIRTRKYRAFPLPGECREVCERVADKLDQGKKTSAYHAKKSALEDAAARAAQDYILQTEQGRRAAEEGWGMALKNEVRQIAIARLWLGKGIDFTDLYPGPMFEAKARAAKLDPGRRAYEKWRAIGFPDGGPKYPPGYGPKDGGQFEPFLHAIRKRMEERRQPQESGGSPKGVNP